MNIKKIRSLRHTRRFNFHHCNKYETVAEHSFYVAMIAYELAKDLDYNTKQIYRTTVYALHHDIEESVTGDIPFLVKRKMANISVIEYEALQELGYDPEIFAKMRLKHNIASVVGFADAYELKMYLEEERLSGNASLFTIERETWGRLLDADIGNVTVKEAWLKKLDTIRPKKIPKFMSHSGEVSND